MLSETYEYAAVSHAMPPVTEDKKELLEDFFRARPLTEVDGLMGWRKGTVRGAVERGEMRYIDASGLPRKGERKVQRERLKVTPLFVAEWVQNYLTCKKPELPGAEKSLLAG